MDASLWGLIGGLVGTIGGVAGAFYGCRASYRRAENDAQRRFFRKLFPWLTLIGLVFIVSVSLSTAGIWPSWAHYLVISLWFAALGPAIYWLNEQLAELAKAPD